MSQIPTEAWAAPRAEPLWDPNDLWDEWRRHHFIYLVVEGLKRAKIKPVNYSQVTTVQQGPDESPSAFLQCFKDAIKKHTTADPESQVRGGSPQG
jgi:hypothetical protein